MRRAADRLRDESGIALLIVLIIVALLTITVVEFTYSVQIDQHRTRNAIHALQSQLLARSGINLAEGFLMLDEEPAFDSYSEDWWLQLVEFCEELQLDESMRIKCRVKDESGKLNINNTREPKRNVEGQAVTVSAVLRDAMKCMFMKRDIDIEIVDKLADYWQQDPGQKSDGTQAGIPDFGSLEDFAATFGISGEEVHKLRNVMTAQPRRVLSKINVNTANVEVLSAVLDAENVPNCGPNEAVEQIVARQQDIENPFRNAGEVKSAFGGIENANIKGLVFDTKSSLYRLEASALSNVDPENPESGGIGQTLTVLVSRKQDTRPRAGERGTSADGKPLPNWTLRALDWQKEGGARLFRPEAIDDSNLPGNPDSQEDDTDGAELDR